jgi:hypothetical protein
MKRSGHVNGMAVANSLAAVRAGARQIECTDSAQQSDRR